MKFYPIMPSVEGINLALVGNPSLTPHLEMAWENKKPASEEAGYMVRPKGFEPPTF